jgi:hypothetical protein
MENRVGLKTLTMLLNEGIQNAGNGDTYMNENNQKKRLANYITDVENIANRNVLGTKNHPVHWRVPFYPELCTKGKNEIKNITLDNKRTRKLMNNLNGLIDISIINPTRREKFRECMKYHNELFIIVRQQHDITNDDIDKFQLLADSFIKHG